MEPVSEKADITRLRELIGQHVAATGSSRGQEILDHFEAYLPAFKKILPHDYDRMLRTIAKFEQRGMTREQAEVEAFYVNTRKGE